PGSSNSSLRVPEIFRIELRGRQRTIRMCFRNHRWYLITEQTCRSGQPGPESPSTDFGLQQRSDERGDVLLQTSPVSQLHLGDERLALHFDGEHGEPVTVACHPGTRRALRTSAQDSQRFVSLCPLF